ncbi:MAG: glycosyltransferase involved in cell wall biosynthesis, partial [Planctomycetaceae bacterium]
AVFIGSGDEDPNFESALRRKASEHHLLGNVHFVPYTNDILSLFLDIDVLVHFTRVGEGFGRVIVEAMAAECGLLVSNNGALPELVDHGQNGFVAQDVEELSSYIKLMASEPECLTQLKATARQMAKQYQAALIARRLETIYDRVLDGVA